MPERRTRLKSSDRVRRNFLCTHSLNTHSCRLPADFFHMLISGFRQLMAAPQAPALEHGAAICRGHALAKAMYAHAAANLRLIRTFGHSSFLISKIMATGLFRPAGHYTVGLPIRSIWNHQSFVYLFTTISRLSAQKWSIKRSFGTSASSPAGR